MSNPRVTNTYKVISDRLRSFSPPICVEHYIDSNLKAGSATTVGITFKPKNFQQLWTEFRSALNGKGDLAFHYHALTGEHWLSHLAKEVTDLDTLDISYLATDGFGFREIREALLPLDDRPLSMSDVRADRLFAGRFAPEEDRRIDITSVHVALAPEVCNIHIDDVGFVLRGPRGQVFMSPDFLEHLINELLFKDKGRKIIGDWAADHLSIILPYSRNNFHPGASLRLDLPEKGMSVSVSFTFGCRCLRGGRVSMEDQIMPIPQGWSIGAGLTLQTNFLDGSPLKKR
jgi:hypothetical protein